MTAPLYGSRAIQVAKVSRKQDFPPQLVSRRRANARLDQSKINGEDSELLSTSHSCNSYCSSYSQKAESSNTKHHTELWPLQPRDTGFFAGSLVALLFFRCLISPAGHKWHRPQLAPCRQPCGFQNQAHGEHFPSACNAEPTEGNGKGAGSTCVGG